MPVDPGRVMAPVSGTAVRRDPYANWRFIPPCVRPWFARRVVVFGPESTGKTTLAERLARHYRTCWVPEYARTWLARHGDRCGDIALIPGIACGQAAAEDALARQCGRLLVLDTDCLTTCVWSETYFGQVPAEVAAEAARRRYDLHLLCDVDVPWVQDGTRDLGHRRAEFFASCRAALEAGGHRYVVLRGAWDERFAAACVAIDPLLASIEPPPAAQSYL